MLTRTPSRPTFSILLPTFNRGSLLPLAIKSVLAQTFADFELVISNGGSTDNTDEVVRSFKDERIVYYQSPERLSMAENYELALRKAQGQYVVFFSDDDAFVPTMLRKVLDAIESTGAKMVVFPFARYYHEAMREHGIAKNTLGLSKFTGRIYSVQSRDDLRRMAAVFGIANRPSSAKHIAPVIGNVAFERRILESLKTRVEQFFSTVPVDIYLLTLILSSIDSYVVLDQPLLVWSQWPENSSIGVKKGLREHYESLLVGRTLDYVPLKFPLPRNCGANALLAAATDIGLDWSIFEIDWNHYYLEMQDYLIYLEGEGVDISREMLELSEAGKRLSVDTRKALASSRTAASVQIRRHLKKSPFRGLLQSIRNRFSVPLEDIMFLGEKEGFKNFLESAGFLDLQLEKT